MTDTKLFYKAVDESGYKLKYIADELDLTYQGLQNKAENVTEFKPSEISKLTILLGLSNNKRDKIFFAQ